jgi:L-malate glycosyltransferase
MPTSPSTPKVCLTTLEFPPDVGGVGESVHRIANMLTDRGYEVHVVVFRSKHAQSKELKRSSCSTTVQNNVFVHRLWAASRLVESTLQDYLSEIYLLLKGLHQTYHFDLLHAFFINETGFLTTLVGREHNIPVINSVRGADLHKHVFDPKQLSQLTWILENSDWTTFVSRELMQRARVLVPGTIPKSSAFWNSIQPIDFSDLPAPQLADQLKGTVIGSVGRFRDKKGLEFLLDACAELKPELDFTLLLVGDFADKERDYWEQQVQASGVGDRLLITGVINRLEGLAYLPYIDIYTVPSLRDGCPNALLEAMLSGRAIVGTRADAIGEILEDQNNGLVVNPGSGSELADAIRTLARSPELRHQFGQAAKAKVLTQLAPSVEAENWCQVYQQVLGTSPVRELAIA